MKLSRRASPSRLPSAELRFSPRRNVIIGENGRGKAQLLKLPYSVMAASADLGKKSREIDPTKTALQGRLAEKIVNVFRPEALGDGTEPFRLGEGILNVKAAYPGDRTAKPHEHLAIHVVGAAEAVNHLGNRPRGALNPELKQ